MSLTTTPVARWVQEPVDPPVLENDQTYSCPVCLDAEPPFWAHQTVILNEGMDNEQRFEGRTHPIHPACIKEWVSRNTSCPTCRVKTVGDFVTLKERVVRATSNTVKNSIAGAKQFENDFFYGIFSVAMIAALEFSGYAKATEVAMVAGYGYGVGSLIGGALGLYSRMNNEPEMATEEAVSFSRFGLITGTLMGSYLSLSGKLLCDPITTAFGVLFFVKGAGFKEVARGAVFGGTISQLAARAPKWLHITKKTAGAIGGVSTALVQHQGHPPAITGLAMKSAWTIAGVAFSALRSYRTVFAVGAIAGAWAIISTKLLQRGQRVIS